MAEKGGGGSSGGSSTNNDGGSEGGGLVDKAVDAAKEAAGDVKEGVEDAVEEVKEGDVGGAVDEAVETGKNVVSGDKDVGDKDKGKDPSTKKTDTSKNDSKSEKSPSKAFDSGIGSESDQLSEGEKGLDLRTRDEKIEDLEESTKSDEITSKNVGSKKPGLTRTDRDQKVTEAFVQNVEAEQKARNVRERTQRQLQKIQSADTNKFNVERNGSVETVSRSEALRNLRESREKASNVIEEAESNQQQITSLNQKQLSLRPVQRDKNVDVGFEDSPTDKNMVNQYPGGTNIPEGFSTTDFRSDPELRKNLRQSQNQVYDAATLASTSAGFQALGTPLSKEKNLEDVLNEKQSQVQGSSTGKRAVEFAGSPLGLIATAGIGKAAGTAVQGSKALSSAANTRAATYVGRSAQAGGLGLVSYQAGKGVGNYAQGDVVKGVGQIAQVTAETGAFLKGFRAASNKYGRKVSKSTEVDQRNVLKQVGDKDESLMVGSGRVTARTPVYQRIPGKGTDPEDLKKVDEITSKAEYRVVADDAGSEAQGTISDSVRNSERSFESVSNVKASEGDKVFVDGKTFNLGKDDRLSNNILRIKDDTGAFRTFEDSSSYTVSRKQGEKGLKGVQRLQTTRIPGKVSQGSFDDGAVAVSKEFDGKVVEFTTYSRTSDGGEVFGDAENLILKADEGRGGAAGFSNGQGLKTKGGGSQARIQESNRQVQAAAQFAERNRQIAKESINDGDGIVGFGSGGSQAEGKQGGLNQEIRQNTQLQNQQQQQQQQVSKVEAPKTESTAKTKEFFGTEDSQETVEMNSKASSIVEEEKQRFNQGVKPVNSQSSVQENKAVAKTGQSQVQQGSQQFGQTQKNIQKPGQVQKPSKFSLASNKSLNIPKLAQVQTVRPETIQLSTGKLGFTNINAPKTGLRPGIGGLPDNRQQRRNFERSDSNPRRNVSSSLNEYVNLDWFSANAVEQATDQEARFDLDSEPDNSLFGLKTVQEKEGDLPERKTISRKFGGNLI